MSWVKSLDAFPKAIDDFRVRTSTGAVVSIVAVFGMVILSIAEFGFYMETHVASSMEVDISRGDTVNIDFDISFSRIPCPLVTIDVMDLLGERAVGVKDSIKKEAIDKGGNPISTATKTALKPGIALDDVEKGSNSMDKTKASGYCGSCYGAEAKAGDCCNTCEEVKRAYKTKGWALYELSLVEQCMLSPEEIAKLQTQLDAKEGCRVFGQVGVSKLSGSLHFQPSVAFTKAHREGTSKMAFDAGLFDTEHKINKFTFGESFPGLVNPLEGIYKGGSPPKQLYSYYNKVVPTSYRYVRGAQTETFQYSFTQHEQSRPADEKKVQLPGITFYYDFSSVMVVYQETQIPFFHFITQLSAIVGGIFTVSGLMDRVIYSALASRKVEVIT